MNIKETKQFRDIFTEDNSNRRVNVVDMQILKVSNAPKWAEDVVEKNYFWVAKLSCGHVAGPYVKLNNEQEIPKRMICSQCRRKKQ